MGPAHLREWKHPCSASGRRLFRWAILCARDSPRRLRGEGSRRPSWPGEPPGGIGGPAGLPRLLTRCPLLLGEDSCKLGQCTPIAESKQTEQGCRQAFQALHLNVAAWPWGAEIWAQLHEPPLSQGAVCTSEMRHPGEKGASCKGKEILLITSVY